MEITRSLLGAASLSVGDARTRIRQVCAKYGLDRIPKNHEILEHATPSDYARLKDLLLKKPAKTASGVAVVALMPMPYACPHGRCTYCPGGTEYNTPNSYTGSEPAVINAIKVKYDPVHQIRTKIDRLVACGHDPAKMEIVIVGGTFLFMPEQYREWFIKSCYDALNGFESASLQEAKVANEHAAIRNVGFTIETKPDYCRQAHIDEMLRYGVTRVEIGVQTLHDSVYGIVNRGHSLDDVTESFQVSKDAGYKIVAHMMPGLPTMTPADDIADFKMLFEDPRFKPDMLKVYPALVLRGTEMHKDYVAGKYRPYSDADMINVLTELKRCVPRWVRIMRIQREIPSGDILAGPKSGNLRQQVHENLHRHELHCRCIRCREIGRSTDVTAPDRLRMERIDYESSGGHEVFLSHVDEMCRIYGFLRLRKPSSNAHRAEITAHATIVRELHVYGRSLNLGERGAVQHAGIGRSLVSEAESVSKEFDSNKILIISAVGTRPYYQKMGYRLQGPYMIKEI